MVALIAVCVAVALFTAIALVLLIAGGDRSSTATRLAELRVRARDQLDEPYSSRPAGVQGILAAVTQPLAPFRNWLKSNDEELTYRLGLAGFRKPEDADTFLTCKMLAPIVGVILATFAPLHDLLLYALILACSDVFCPGSLFVLRYQQAEDKNRESTSRHTGSARHLHGSRTGHRPGSRTNRR